MPRVDLVPLRSICSLTEKGIPCRIGRVLRVPESLACLSSMSFCLAMVRASSKFSSAVKWSSRPISYALLQ